MKEEGRTVTPQDQKGCTESPLFDVIPMENYLLGVLHCVDLFVNTVKDLLDTYIDHRLEN